MVGVPRGTVDRILAPRPAVLGSILGVPQFFREISPEFFSKKYLMLPRFIDSALLKERVDSAKLNS